MKHVQADGTRKACGAACGAACGPTCSAARREKEGTIQATACNSFLHAILPNAIPFHTPYLVSKQFLPDIAGTTPAKLLGCFAGICGSS